MRKPSQQQSLEEELQLLLRMQQEGQDYSLDSGKENDAKEVKNRVRALKNRLAAKKSRDQARCYVQKLEAQISTLHAQNDGLSQQLSLANFKIQSLVAENEKLRRRQRSDTKPRQDSIERKYKYESRYAGGLMVETNDDVDGSSDSQSYHSSPVNFLASEPPAMGVGLVTLEQWRKERRRLQHRKAQRKQDHAANHKSRTENLKTEQSTEVQSMEYSQAEPVPVSQESQSVQIASGWQGTFTFTTPSQEPNDFPPPSLSRNSSNGLSLSRQNSFFQTAREGEEFWLNQLSYCEITTM
ncbi:hypothetical protein GUITHDRAFT_163033 [Guillardia theta CCMP2712]|uniref:BZIP domain-containing protein n=1 Tax=Guillardia theta (strain CCMP2712) TaxID=905079 RepID=L1JDD7_GUITC|nr:hypothetical protein GUITHDRAFT_163033 [Guillardia theta CCMP2712]EKX46287.1 hypothetical protein GUITHDRAFT_163033 [Guillardia theta CCMP2712]|mmetsp:Transcript_23316/g.75794  ORF Transcript_23316/g.75794 Transcript_23316/m.75794 type:complete len:297 (-) Transcript_23316:65-955(-)|eukprot:XP_005833267.1 hypothetical protein GUITHDRAFT_163033 [Guillardia theta CCMP2712]